MKTFRTDLTAFGALALLVVATVVLSLNGKDVPEWMSALAAILFVGGVGAALPTKVELGQPATSSTPATSSAPAPVLSPVPTPRMEAAPFQPTPGWDHTETFPAITDAQIEADKAARP